MEISTISGFTIVSVIAVVIGGLITNYILRRNRRGKWRDAGEDVVVLHMYPRCRDIPCYSPFVLKLETFLRMAEIPYQTDFEEHLGPKGKCPWISLNGEDIGDSQLIIEMLSKKFSKDFRSHLTPQQKGIALTLRITMEEHFLWCLAVWRFGTDAAHSFLEGLEAPKIFRAIMPIYRRRVLKMAHTQGLGRHSDRELEEMGRKDLAAISTILGDNSFFMGEEPSEVDCAMFGFLAQLVWGLPTYCPYYKMMESEFTNLKSYCIRMKERFWPDWNSCLNPPKSEEESLNLSVFQNEAD